MSLTYVRVPWHVVIATVIVAVLIAALPQAAEAATKRQRCIATAEKALGHDIQPSDYRILLGSDLPKERFRTSSRKDLICGFGGTDWVRGTMKAGDIFIGGAGTSYVLRMEGGLVIGGPDIDIVDYMSGGRFYGRKGDLPEGQDARGDTVGEMHGGLFHGGRDHDVVLDLHSGRFIGGSGPDFVALQYGGIYLGKNGSDRVDFLRDGRFKGGAGNDGVGREMSGGVFNGGSGTDTVRGYEAGRLFSVELCTKPKTACP
jgi:hypothetical protein